MKKIENKNKNNIFLLIIPLILAIGYLIYTIFIAQNKIDYLYTILNGTLISTIITTIGIILYTKKETIKKITSILIIIFILLLVDLNVGYNLGFIKLPKQATVKDFTKKNITEVIKWASKNKIELIQIQEYSETIDENLIINQSKKENTLTKNIKQLEVIVSKGPNPDTRIELKNLVGTNIDEALKEIKKLKLNNIIIDYTFSSIEKDQILKQSIEGKINRSDELILEVSLGEEEDLQPVKLIDLQNKTEFEATLWLKRNGIKYNIKYEFDEKIKRGNIISTTPKKDTIINQKEQTIDLIISKGAKIKVPNLQKMSLEEIIKWTEKYNLKIKYNSEYDSEIKKGEIKYISCKENDIIEEGTTIYITTSNGPLKMIDYKETEIDKIRTFANTYKIAINEIMEYSNDVSKGNIIRASHKKGDNVNSTDTIEVVISLGKSIIVPNFTGMSMDKAKELCNEKSLSCITIYKTSSQTKNTVISQNKKANSEVIEGTNVILYISNQKATNNQTTNNNTTTNTQNNNTPSNNNNNVPEEPKCDTSKTTVLNIQPGETGENTKKMIINMNKNVKFAWNMVTSCPNGATTPGTVCNGDVLEGKTVDYCSTITVTIVK